MSSRTCQCLLASDKVMLHFLKLPFEPCWMTSLFTRQVFSFSVSSDAFMLLIGCNFKPIS